MPEDKDQIIDRLVKNLAEVITEDEFRARLESSEDLMHYIGFEISGPLHIGQGLMTALVMKDLVDLGVHCTVWLADWHTAINHKLDGTRQTAESIARGYFTEAIKASFLCAGGNPDKLDIRVASDWYAKDPMKYWELVMRVGQNTTEARIKRSISIMGKEEGDSVEPTTLMYPLMQVADIVYQQIDIAHSAMDQRKAHVVMRDVFDKVVPDKPKPVAIHHALIDSLDGEAKMSKSRPNSAVFIHDTAEEIERKIKKAFAEEKNTEKNPILNWAKNILFWNRTKPFNVNRKEEHGGDLEFSDYADLEAAYASGDLHPMDLKQAVAEEIVSLLQPARDHFAKPEIAAKKEELENILAGK